VHRSLLLKAIAAQSLTRLPLAGACNLFDGPAGTVATVRADPGRDTPTRTTRINLPHSMIERLKWQIGGAHVQTTTGNWITRRHRATPFVERTRDADQGLRVMTMYATPTTMKRTVFSVEMIPST
jgi:hypothetical protein